MMSLRTSHRTDDEHVAYASQQHPVEEKIAPSLTEQDKKTQGQRKFLKTLLWVSGLLVVAIILYVIYEVYTLVG